MPNDIANNMADTIHELEKELKDLREENKVLTRDCLRLIKANGKLRKKLGQIAKYKRLLKAAVEDFNSIGRVLEGNDILCMKYIACKGCPFDGDNCNKWRYADEAENLLSDEK